MGGHRSSARTRAQRTSSPRNNRQIAASASSPRPSSHLRILGRDIFTPAPASQFANLRVLLVCVLLLLRALHLSFHALPTSPFFFPISLQVGWLTLAHSGCSGLFALLALPLMRARGSPGVVAALTLTMLCRAAYVDTTTISTPCHTMPHHATPCHTAYRHTRRLPSVEEGAPLPATAQGCILSEQLACVCMCGLAVSWEHRAPLNITNMPGTRVAAACGSFALAAVRLRGCRAALPACPPAR